VIVVIDSHTLYWWIEESPLLSKKAAELLNSAEEKGANFYLSPVTFWELRMKQLKGQLESRIPITRWPEVIEDFEWMEMISPDTGIWLQAAEMGWKHRDPADRLIAATALKYGVTVLTKDTKFHLEDSPVEAVW